MDYDFPAVFWKIPAGSRRKGGPMEETPLKQKKSSPWLIAAFVLMNVGVLLWTGLSELNRRNEDTAGFSQIRFRWGFLVLSVLFFAVAFAAETLKYYSMMRQMTERKDYGTAFRVALYGRYYDNITPSGAGGQPFQIYFLRRCGLKQDPVPRTHAVS